MDIKRSYGFKSLVCLLVAISLTLLFFATFKHTGNIEIIINRGFFVSVFVALLVGMIFDILGLLRDEEKALSIGLLIAYMIIIALICYMIYYFMMQLPKIIDVTVDALIKDLL